MNPIAFLPSSPPTPPTPQPSPALYELTFRLSSVARGVVSPVTPPTLGSPLGAIRVEGFLKKLSRGGVLSKPRWQAGRCVRRRRGCSFSLFLFAECCVVFWCAVSWHAPWHRVCTRSRHRAHPSRAVPCRAPRVLSSSSVVLTHDVAPPPPSLPPFRVVGPLCDHRYFQLDVAAGVLRRYPAGPGSTKGPPGGKSTDLPLTSIAGASEDTPQPPGHSLDAPLRFVVRLRGGGGRQFEAASTEEARVWVAAIAAATGQLRQRGVRPGDSAALVATSELESRVDALMARFATAPPGTMTRTSSGRGSPTFGPSTPLQVRRVCACVWCGAGCGCRACWLLVAVFVCAGCGYLVCTCVALPPPPLH